MTKKPISGRMIVLISLLIILVLSLTTVTLGWLAFESNDINATEVGGQLLTTYFHTGNGTKGNPFVITRPIHYYNLVNLYQRVSDYSDKHYYFQLGTQLKDGDPGYYVYNYDEHGKLIEDDKYSQTLNLSCYDENDPLYPIGTHDKNFLGRFDGKGLTISGFTVAAPENKQWCDIGIFGYIGEGLDGDGNGTIEGEEVAAVNNVYFSNVTIDLRNVTNVVTAIEAGQTHDATAHTLENPDKTTRDVAYVGYIAGHVITSTQMTNVFINDVTIQGGSSALTSFGYFGCIATSTGANVPSLGSQIATMFGAGDEAGFGGTMDIKKLYTRIQTVLGGNYGGVSRTRFYPTTEVVNYSEDNKAIVSITASDTTQMTNDGTPPEVYLWTNPSIGTGNYIGANRTSQYNYLFGLTQDQTTTVSVSTNGNMNIEVHWIKSGDNYLSVNNKAFTTSTQIENGAMWFVDSAGHWLTYIEEGTVNGQPNYTAYYLNVDSSCTVVLQDSLPMKATVWTDGNDGTFTTVINDTTYYLVQYNGTWLLTAHSQYRPIGDGQGHFMYLNNSGAIENIANPARWQVQNTGNNYNFYSEVGLTRYYLSYNNGLSTSTMPSTWVKDGNGYYIESGGDHYYLTYENGEWIAQSYSKHKLSSNSHYISANNGTLTDETNANSAVEWNIKGNGSGYTISVVQNGQRYYLTYSSPLSVTLSTTPFTWQKNGNSYYHILNGANYYLQYTYNSWYTLPQNYFTIQDENLYMTATAPNTFSTTEDAASATRFYSTSNTLSGQIMYIVGGQVCYLGGNGTNLVNTDTTWVQDDTKLYVQGTNYYLNYTAENGWCLEEPTNVTKTGYTIQDDSYDRYINASGTSVSLGTNAGSATLWFFSGPGKSGKMSYIDNNGTEYFLTSNGSLTTTEADAATWKVYNSNRLYSGSANDSDTYLGVRRSGYFWNYSYSFSTTLGQGTNGGALSFAENNVTVTSVPEVTVATNTPAAPALADSVTYPATPPAIVIGDSVNDTDNFSVGKYENDQVLTGYITSKVRRSTYIPIRVNSDDKADASANVAYGVSPKNTGYIVGGTYSPEDQGRGDIRVSYYTRRNSINNSFNGSTLTSVFTCNDNAARQNITNDLRNRDSALFNTFQQLLVDSGSNVYGLHFMDSKIGKDKIIQAETATVMGKTYINYDLPESCIDFNVVQPGSIKFFAGDYYRYNNSFFSLHEIFRDPVTKKIVDIKEIQFVYEHEEEKILKPYIYMYKDGTYSAAYYDEETNFSDYVQVFNTDWITQPNGVTTTGNSIYYFEIPCNKGEFALGSVEGKKGAYLIYLDIGTNGGKVIDTVVSEDGSGLTGHDFLVDVRPTGGTIDNRSLMQFGIDIPAVENSNDFSVKVSFTSNVSGIEGSNDFRNGLYTIEIVNGTGVELKVDMFLCDNDIRVDDYPYAFKIIYSNSTVQNKTLMNGDFDYFKRCGTMKIPASG